MSEPGPVTFRDALRVWIKIALLSFGGPTGQIAVMHRLLVEERKWISDNRFLHALNYCMLLPGPEAHQLVTYTGWLMHGLRGGLVAGLLFILPGAISLLALSVVYVEYQHIGAVQGIFYGLKAAVVAVVVEAVIRIGKRVLKNPVMIAIAIASFVAIYFFRVPFPFIIGIAALLGFVGGRVREDLFYIVKPRTGAKDSDVESQYLISDRSPAAGAVPTLSRTLMTILTWLVVWWAPVAICVQAFGPNSVYVAEGVFFSEAAMVTFGGAYAVLPFVAQEAVERHHWLTVGEMQDGLGMAETTPGPLIIVLQFVGFLGAYRDPGSLSPLTGGVLGSAITTWVTFAPSFMWIFVGAPWIERLRGNKLLSTALSAVTAAVVGVVVNLAVWFALKTLVIPLEQPTHNVFQISVGGLPRLDLAAILIAVASGVALIRYHVNLLWVLGACAILGWLACLCV